MKARYLTNKLPIPTGAIVKVLEYDTRGAARIRYNGKSYQCAAWDIKLLYNPHKRKGK